jgi:hypothetical protein
MTDRKKPGVAFWATVVVVCLPLLYVLSFGPACWLVDRGWLSARRASQVFRPIILTIGESETVRSAANLYAGFASDRPGWTVIRLMDAAGLIEVKSGVWPRDMEHDIPHRSDDELWR